MFGTVNLPFFFFPFFVLALFPFIIFFSEYHLNIHLHDNMHYAISLFLAFKNLGSSTVVKAQRLLWKKKCIRTHFTTVSRGFHVLFIKSA